MYKILLVDDETKACKFLAGILRTKGYTVDMAYSGETALRVAMKEEPDIIFLDIEMPVMSGMETYECLRELGVSSAVIFLTAHVKFSYAVEAIKLGADDYILKPINNVDNLFDSILRTINSLEHKRKVKLYGNILPVCCECRKIRDDTDCAPGTGRWVTMEVYLEKRAKISCSHGYCEECSESVMKSLAQRRRGVIDNEKLKENYVESSADTARRMLRITEADSGGSGYIVADIQEIINQAIEYTEQRWKDTAQTKGVKYHICSKGLVIGKPIVKCNSVKMREVFINIINNALNAMPDGGSILFNIRMNSENVLIKITDTGHGMTEEVRKRMFDPFCPEETELGMSIVYGVIKRHGGAVEVQSRVGKGTKIIINIPVAIGKYPMTTNLKY